MVKLFHSSLTIFANTKIRYSWNKCSTINILHLICKNPRIFWHVYSLRVLVLELWQCFSYPLKKFHDFGSHVSSLHKDSVKHLRTNHISNFVEVDAFGHNVLWRGSYSKSFSYNFSLNSELFRLVFWQIQQLYQGLFLKINSHKIVNKYLITGKIISFSRFLLIRYTSLQTCKNLRLKFLLAVNMWLTLNHLKQSLIHRHVKIKIKLS